MKRIINRYIEQKRKHGFTLAETLLVIGILVILLAFSIPGVMNQAKRVRLQGRDDIARDVYFTIQTQLVYARTSGLSAEVDKNLNDVLQIYHPTENEGFVPLSALIEEAGWLDLSGAVTDPRQCLVWISIGKDERGRIVNSSLLGVFYTEETVFYTGSSDANISNDKAAIDKLLTELTTGYSFDNRLKNGMVGFYGETTSTVAPVPVYVQPDPESPIENLTVNLVNGEELYAEVTLDVNGLNHYDTVYDKIAFDIVISDETEETVNYTKTRNITIGEVLDSIGGQNEGQLAFRLLLDSISHPFGEDSGLVSKGLRPGDDITVSVTASFQESSDSPTYTLYGEDTENSLFGVLDTEANTITVKTLRHLHNLARYGLEGYQVYQMADITYGGGEYHFAVNSETHQLEYYASSADFPQTHSPDHLGYAPVCSSFVPANIGEAVVYNGWNKKLKDFALSDDSTDGAEMGVFGSLNGWTLKNLTVENARISAAKGVAGALAGNLTDCVLTGITVTDATVTGGQAAGGVAGSLTDCDVEKVTVTGATVTGTDAAGGVAGTVSGGSMKDVHAEKAGSSSLAVTATSGEAGGIAGTAENGCEIENVTVTGATVSGATAAGGLAGSVTGGSVQTVEIKDCIVPPANDTNGIPASNKAGGLAGALSSCAVSEVTVTDPVITGTAAAGGLAGTVEGGSLTDIRVGKTAAGTFTVTACGAAGKAGGVAGKLSGGSVDTAAVTDFTVSAAGSSGLAGGLAGSLVDGAAVTGAKVYSADKSTGDVSAALTGGIAGGLVGSATNCTFTSSFASAINVTGCGGAGGFAGVLSASGSGSSSVTRCYGNTRKLNSASGNVGGFAASLLDSVTVTGCYAVSEVLQANGSNGTAAGFAASVGENNIISKCYALVGSVATGNGSSGKVKLGFAPDQRYAADCYYYAAVKFGASQLNGRCSSLKSLWASVSALKIGDSSAFVAAEAEETHPYRTTGQYAYMADETNGNKPYGYYNQTVTNDQNQKVTVAVPGYCISGLPHYGDWPEESAGIILHFYINDPDNPTQPLELAALRKEDVSATDKVTLEAEWDPTNAYWASYDAPDLTWYDALHTYMEAKGWEFVGWSYESDDANTRFVPGDQNSQFNPNYANKTLHQENGENVEGEYDVFAVWCYRLKYDLRGGYGKDGYKFNGTDGKGTICNTFCFDQLKNGEISVATVGIDPNKPLKAAGESGERWQFKEWWDCDPEADPLPAHNTYTAAGQIPNVTEGIVLYAVYEREYTVKYCYTDPTSADSETYYLEDEQYGVAGKAMTILSDPVRKDEELRFTSGQNGVTWLFAGWKSSHGDQEILYYPGENGKYPDAVETFTMPDADVTFTAQWVEGRRVQYQSMGWLLDDQGSDQVHAAGKLPEDNTYYIAGETVTLLEPKSVRSENPDTTKMFSIVGWHHTDAPVEEFVFDWNELYTADPSYAPYGVTDPVTMPEGDIYLYPAWAQVKNTIAVTLRRDGALWDPSAPPRLIDSDNNVYTATRKSTGIYLVLGVDCQTARAFHAELKNSNGYYVRVGDNFIVTNGDNIEKEFLFHTVTLRCEDGIDQASTTVTPEVDGRNLVQLEAPSGYHYCCAVLENTKVRLSANAITGYTFYAWMESGGLFSRQSSLYVTVTRKLVLSAISNSYPVSVTVNGVNGEYKSQENEYSWDDYTQSPQDPDVWIYKYYILANENVANNLQVYTVRAQEFYTLPTAAEVSDYIKVTVNGVPRLFGEDNYTWRLNGDGTGTLTVKNINGELGVSIKAVPLQYEIYCNRAVNGMELLRDRNGKPSPVTRTVGNEEKTYTYLYELMSESALSPFYPWTKDADRGYTILNGMGMGDLWGRFDEDSFVTLVADGYYDLPTADSLRIWYFDYDEENHIYKNKTQLLADNGDYTYNYQISENNSVTTGVIRLMKKKIQGRYLVIEAQCALTEYAVNLNLVGAKVTGASKGSQPVATGDLDPWNVTLNHKDDYLTINVQAVTEGHSYILPEAIDVTMGEIPCTPGTDYTYTREMDANTGKYTGRATIVLMKQAAGDINISMICLENENTVTVFLYRNGQPWGNLNEPWWGVDQVALVKKDDISAYPNDPTKWTWKYSGAYSSGAYYVDLTLDPESGSAGSDGTYCIFVKDEKGTYRQVFWQDEPKTVTKTGADFASARVYFYTLSLAGDMGIEGQPTETAFSPSDVYFVAADTGNMYLGGSKVTIDARVKEALVGTTSENQATFNGWQRTGETKFFVEGEESSNYTIPGIADRLRLTAVSTLRTYPIYYIDVDTEEVTISGDLPTEYRYTEGVTVPALSRIGARFVGWKLRYGYVEADGTPVYLDNNTDYLDDGVIPGTQTGSAILSPRWDYRSYTLTLDPCGVSFDADAAAAAGYVLKDGKASLSYNVLSTPTILSPVVTIPAAGPEQEDEQRTPVAWLVTKVGAESSWTLNDIIYPGDTLSRKLGDVTLKAIWCYLKVEVNLDNDNWTNHGRSIYVVNTEGLRIDLENGGPNNTMAVPEHAQTFYAFAAVPDGEWTLYADGKDTGITFTIAEGRTDAYLQDLDYYSVTYLPNTGTYTGYAPAPANYLNGSRVSISGNVGILQRTENGSPVGTFMGWATNPDLLATGVKYYQPGEGSILIDHKIELSAIWGLGCSGLVKVTKNGNTWTVDHLKAWDLDGNRSMSSDHDADYAELQAGLQLAAEAANMDPGIYFFRDEFFRAEGEDPYEGWNSTGDKESKTYDATVTVNERTVRYDFKLMKSGTNNKNYSLTVFFIGPSTNDAPVFSLNGSWETDSNNDTTITVYAPELFVTYAPNGAEGGFVPTYQKPEDNTYTVPGNTGTLVREGYRFLGWSTEPDPDLTAENLALYGPVVEQSLAGKYRPTVELTQNWVFYAVWEPENQEETYKLHYYVHDGNGTAFVLSESAAGDEQEGYKGTRLRVTREDPSDVQFYGWCIQGDDSGTIYKNGDLLPKSSEDIDLYAQYSAGTVFNRTKAERDSEETNAWYDTLHEAVADANLEAGDVLVVYRDVTEDRTVTINKDLTIIAMGDRTVSWNVTNTAASAFMNCLFVQHGVTLTLGDPNGMNGGKLTFNANQKGRVVYLEGCFFVDRESLGGGILKQYSGVILTGGKVDDKSDNNYNGFTTYRFNKNNRTYRPAYYSNYSQSYDSSYYLWQVKQTDANYNGNTYYERLNGQDNWDSKFPKHDQLGGGVFVDCHARYYMYGGEIRDCKANTGGGVYLEHWGWMSLGEMAEVTTSGGTPSIPYSKTQNYYVRDKDNPAIYYYPEDMLELKGIEIPQATADTYATGFTYHEGQADEYHYAYYVASGSGKISGCIATASGNAGGGIMCGDITKDSLLLYSGVITGNAADNGRGGGIMLDASNNLGTDENNPSAGNEKIWLRFYEVELSYNKAKLGGGACVNQGTLYLYSCKVFGNQATSNGGGIYVGHYHHSDDHERTVLRFLSGDIYDNYAKSNGGGIYIDGITETVLVNGNIFNNRAGNLGGGIYVGNTTYYNGSAIGPVRYVDLQGGNIYGNTDKNGSNDIYFKVKDNGYLLTNTTSTADRPLSGRLNRSVSAQGRKVVVTIDGVTAGGELLRYVDATSLVVKDNSGNYVCRYQTLRSVSAELAAADAACFTYSTNLKTSGASNWAFKGDANTERLVVAEGCKVTYLNGGQANAILPENDFLVQGSTYAVSSVVPQVTGWRFLKWQASGGLSGDCYPGDVRTINANTTLTAVWQPEITVVYDANGSGVTNLPGTEQNAYVVGDEFVPNGDKTPAREGYLFVGWALESNAAEAITKLTIEESMLTGSELTLYAIWSNAVTVSYHSGVTGGESLGAFFDPDPLVRVYVVNSTVDVVFPSQDLYPNGENLRSGYRFLGWSQNPGAQNPDFSVDGFRQFALGTVNVDLYAVWERGYRMIYDLNYTPGVLPEGMTAEEWRTGTVVDLGTYSRSGQVMLMFDDPALYQRSGYRFLGWNPVSNAPMPEFAVDGKVKSFPIGASDYTLYAIWGALCEIRYHVSEAPDSEYETEYVGAGDTVNLMHSLPGQTVIGWKDSSGTLLDGLVVNAEYVDLYPVLREASGGDQGG